MKTNNFYLVWILLAFFNVISYSQSPQGIPYQGVARNAVGTIMASQPITLRLSIHDETTNGTVVFSETHAITTTSLGQFSIIIGQGSPITGTLASINWGNDAKFLQVELSTNAGSTYIEMGTTQFMSVPYALYAENVNENSVANIVSSINDEGVGKIMVLYTSTNAYGFYQNSTGGGFWNITPISGNIIGYKATKDMIVLYTATTAYGFNQSGTNNGSWNIQTLTGTPQGIVASGSQIVVYTNSNAYGFSIRSFLTGGVWDQQSITGQIIGHATTSKSILLYTSTNLYAFYQRSNEIATWNIQPLSGTPINAINAK